MSDRQRGTLKAVLNCLAEQRKHESRRITSVAIMVQDWCAFRKGDYVLVRDYDGKECTVEHAMTPDEIDFQKATGSLLTTLATCIGFPCDYLHVDRDMTELAERLATLESENARLKKSANAWDALYSMLQAVLEPEVPATDDEPGDAKLNAYIDVYRRLKAENDRLKIELADAKSDAKSWSEQCDDARELFEKERLENVRLAALVERLAKWLPDPERMSGWGDPDATEEANMAITEVMALLAALSPTPTPAEQRPGEAKEEQDDAVHNRP